MLGFRVYVRVYVCVCVHAYIHRYTHTHWVESVNLIFPMEGSL